MPTISFKSDKLQESTWFCKNSIHLACILPKIPKEFTWPLVVRSIFFSVWFLPTTIIARDDHGSPTQIVSYKVYVVCVTQTIRLTNKSSMALLPPNFTNWDCGKISIGIKIPLRFFLGSDCYIFGCLMAVLLKLTHIFGLN